MSPALIRPITALLLSTAIVLMGSGLIGVLVPIRAAADGAGNVEIGLIGSGYWLGLTIGCLIAPLIIRRVGHIRAFVAFTATVTAVPLLLAMSSDWILWTALRAMNGICFAGIQMVIESWLAATTKQESRGRVLALYTILNMTVVTIGMQLVNLAPITSFQLFIIVGLLFTLAAVPIALTLTPPPTPPRSTRTSLKWLFRISPAAVIGCFAAGLVGGIFWSMAPVFGTGIGLSPQDTALLMTVVVLAGAAAQWPIGLLSDSVGRRPAMLIVSAIAAAGAAALTLAAPIPGPLLFAAAAVYGTVAFASYPIALALANDMIPQRRAVTVSSGLLLTYAAGAIAGPTIASVATGVFGTDKLFAVSALIHMAAIIAIIVRIGLRPELPDRHQGDFVSLPRTTPAIFEMDPQKDPAFDEPSEPATHDNDEKKQEESTH